MHFVPFIALVATALVGHVRLCSGQDLATSYAPIRVQCPTDVQWIRPATGLAQVEANWVHGRKKVVAEALEGYLLRLQMKDFDACEYVCRLRASNYSLVPTLGLAISGGGWNSAFTGTGAVRALDARLDAAVQQGTGGLLQSMTYLSGLSGGSWPVMSFAVHNFPTADEIVDLWQPQIDRLNGVTNTTQYAVPMTSLFADVVSKLEAGFNATAADYFGRAWAYEFVANSPGGVNGTFSAVSNLSHFAQHQMPLPIIQLIEIDDRSTEYFGLQIPFSNATNYEVTPFEFGAWNGSVSAFTPTEWLGTRLLNGSVVNSSSCVRGFDRASFIIGGSADALNFWYIEGQSNGSLAAFSKRDSPAGAVGRRSLSPRGGPPLSELEGLYQGFNEVLHENQSAATYAVYPNPFAALDSATTTIRGDANLRLMDGSEAGQAIPLWSQIQPARKPSFLIAWDANSDASPYFWNNGTNLRDTYVAANASGLPFPIVPPATTFVNRNYTTQPVFFGCDARLTTTGSADAPIVLYLANAPYSAYTNYSFFQETTSLPQMSEILENSFNLVTQGNGTLDAEWAVCLACAAIDRSLAQVDMPRSTQCAQCLDRYCWDGTDDNRPPGIVDLSLRLHPTLTFAEWNQTSAL
ncbi:MAG: hypothetical protein M1838_001871 [Thelocarpon superellum]|nr:MAG: hypothetical protein M1838_001871 [Thelocarpon superellum]